MTVTIANTVITCFADLNQLSTAEILAAYNEATGKGTKQFAKRATGMKQLWSAIADKVEAAHPQKQMEVTPVAQQPAVEQAKAAEIATTPVASAATAPAAPAAAPSTAEEAPPAAKPAGLKTRVDDLLATLTGGPKTVAEITQALGLENEKRARSLIDTARRVGHSIACVGRGTFALSEAAQ